MASTITQPASVDHPRPFLQRAWQSLDGPRDFELDREHDHDHPTEVRFAGTIVVPFAPECPASGAGPGGGGVDGYAQRCWYRKTLHVDAPADHERLLVHFNGVDRIADVWASGTHVGHHVGGYTAFSVDVTAAAGTGVVELIVRADDDGHDLSVPRGKQEWQEQPHAIFYPRTTGIWKTVWLENPRYFSLADRMGLLTWVEMPSAYRPGRRASAQVVREWTEIVEAHRNHPSVIAWVPINESWGAAGCEHDPAQRALIEALHHATDSLDGTRPVSANDGWETVGGDIVGIHDYDQDPAELLARWGDRAAVDAVIAGRRPDGHTVDLDHSPAGDRALVLSEFGGIALATDTDASSFSMGTGNWGYDTAVDSDDLLVRYRALWAAVHASTALVGACWTQLTDTYQEVNGLLTADRRPKGDLAALADATRGVPPGPAVDEG